MIKRDFFKQHFYTYIACISTECELKRYVWLYEMFYIVFKTFHTIDYTPQSHLVIEMEANYKKGFFLTKKLFDLTIQLLLDSRWFRKFKVSLNVIQFVSSKRITPLLNPLDDVVSINIVFIEKNTLKNEPYFKEIDLIHSSHIIFYNFLCQIPSTWHLNDIYNEKYTKKHFGKSHGSMLRMDQKREQNVSFWFSIRCALAIYVFRANLTTYGIVT